MVKDRPTTDELIRESEALRAQLVATAAKLERFVRALEFEISLDTPEGDQ